MNLKLERLLQLGIAVPIMYFGLQLIAMPFYPGYSLLVNAASDLGSPSSNLPAVFNVGAIVSGLLTALSAYGFARAFQRFSITPILAWPASLAVALTGLSSVWAGTFPLPNPKHAENPMAIGLFLMPFILAAALWKPSSLNLRIYLLANILAFGLLAAIMSGIIPVDQGAYGGLLQRILALIAFAPIGVGAAFLLARVQGANQRKGQR
jgi:hypothetical membrane protein